MKVEKLKGDRVRLTELTQSFVDALRPRPRKGHPKRKRDEAGNIILGSNGKPVFEEGKLKDKPKTDSMQFSKSVVVAGLKTGELVWQEVKAAMESVGITFPKE